MANTYITRTPASNGNQRTWTFSAWIKNNGKSGDSTYQYLMEAYYGNGTRYSYVCLRHGTIETYGGDYSTSSTSLSFDVTTNRRLRDPSAWYHVVVTHDTTESTSTDRLKIYINGERETSFQGYVGSGASATFPDQNDDTFFNVTTTQNRIGKEFDGSMAHVHFVDGTAYDASTFGETDSTSGIWKPKLEPSVTYGTNGFFLKFENSGNMDLDSSSNNLTFATTGTLTQNVDTPSNNFATLNPNSSLSNLTYANGNLQVTGASSTVWKTTFSSIGMMYGKAGKFYCEMKVSSLNSQAGIGGWGQPISVLTTSNFFPNHHQYGFIYKEDGSVSDDSQTFYTGSSFTSGDIIQCALDLTNSKIYFGKNGTWQNSGDPTSGSTGTGAVALEDNSDAYFFTASSYGTDVLQMNFGQGYFGTTAVASAGSNASGIGTFEYDVPAGYTALSTKGLDI